ncbi:MAG: SpoIIE family protein phosphatase [Betaproteobacteria bacterium]
MPILTVQNGRQQHATFEFQNPIVIGRDGTADVVLADPSVSRRHAMLLLEHATWAVQDLGSGNGTFLNNRLVSRPVPVATGDQLRFGSVVVTFDDAPPRPKNDTSVRVLDTAGTQVLVRVPSGAARGGAAGRESADAIASQRFLDDLGRISTMVFDEPALLAFVVDELFELMPRAERAFVMVWDPELKRLIPKVARTRSGRPAQIDVSRTLLDEVLAKREAVLVVDAADGPYSQAESILALRIRSAVCAPLIFQNEIYGVVQVDTASGAPFSRADVSLALGIGSQVGMALAYARLHASVLEQQLIERDLDLAGKIQHHFLPASVPAVPGFAFAVEYRPALAVGGDLYDFLDLGGGLHGIVVGDVSGKGISAALFAAKLLADLRYVSAGLTSAGTILARVNDALASRDNEGMFVTAVLAVLEARTGRFSIASAGHPLPLARDRAGSVAPVGRTGGSPLGMVAGATFEEHQYEIEPGDAVVLYTDGVTEALNPSRELFGDTRLTAAIHRAAPAPAALVRALDVDLQAFASGAAQSDDVTIVAFGRD